MLLKKTIGALTLSLVLYSGKIIAAEEAKDAGIESGIAKQKQLFSFGNLYLTESLKEAGECEIGKEIKFKDGEGREWTVKYASIEQGYDLNEATLSFLRVTYDKFTQQSNLSVILTIMESDGSYQYADKGDRRRSTEATLRTTLEGCYLAHNPNYLCNYLNVFVKDDGKTTEFYITKNVPVGYTFGTLGYKGRVGCLPDLVETDPETVQLQIKNHKEQDPKREEDLYLKP